jgi:uracil-DNA glycosylase
MDDRQQRAWQALELGPTWRLRQAPRVSGAAPDGCEAPNLDSLDWDALQVAVDRCPDCPLSGSRTRSVFGSGAPTARWMLVGAAPGADDDATGEPFSGDAGRLLAQMLAATGIDADGDVFVTQRVKCRPPDDRDPLPDEETSCRRYLARQAAIVDPMLVVALGGAAARSLLATDAALESLRGSVHRVSLGGRDVPLVVTFEPRHLLGSPADKAGAWADLCLARSVGRARDD